MHKEIVFIGLGRMGSALCVHLVEKGYTVHGFDENSEASKTAASKGILTYSTIEEAVGAVSESPKTIWIMVPSAYVDDVLKKIKPLLKAGETVIDGGNSFFKDTLRRHDELMSLGIHYIDCGTSGGVSGARTGASLMVGGETAIVQDHKALFTDLSIDGGYAHVGGPGSGHFTKMVHNAIEYGMMGAIAEGVNILNEHQETLTIDINEALKPYQHGSIIESNLMSWLSNAFNTKGFLEQIAGEVPKGETEMEMEYLILHENVSILEAAVLQRKRTRTEPSYTGTLISAMRNKFGGHKILVKETKQK